MNDTMHDEHDPDLIAALAEGRLEDPAAAQHLVRTCSECADAYRAHVAVLEAVASESDPALDDLERRRLSEAVWDEMRPNDAPAKSGTPWWYRVVPVAAVLAVVVGVGSILVTGGGGDSAESFDLAAGDAMTEFRTTAESADDAVEDTAGADTTGARTQTTRTFADAAAQPEVAEGGTDTTTAAAADTTSDTTSDVDGGGEPIDVTSEELAEAATEFAERVAAANEVGMVGASARECLEGDPDHQVLASQEALVDGQPAIFVARGDQGDVSGVIVYARPTCEVLYAGGP